MRRLEVMLSVIGLGIIATLLSCVTLVRPGEVLVIRRYGRALSEPWGPGIHLRLPFGLDRADRIRLDEIRRLEVGLGDETPVTSQPPGAGEFLTGDSNFLRAKAVLQYRVEHPVAFLTSSTGVEQILGRLLESSLSRVFTSSAIEPLLRDGRTEAARRVLDDLRVSAQRAQLGLELLSVSLTDLQPPVEVAADFADAQTAASERDRQTQDAESEANTRITKSKADATQILERAKANAEHRLTIGRARASSFLELLAEFEKSRDLTLRRLYADAVRDVMGKVRRKVIGDGEAVDLSLFGTPTQQP